VAAVRRSTLLPSPAARATLALSFSGARVSMTPKKQPGDLDKLQGSWRVTALEMDGNEQSGALPAATITVSGSAFTTRGMGDDYAGTIELDPGKKPKAFDLLFTSGPPNGMRNRGIYTLTGDTWTICIATRGDTRPRRFATRPDSGLALETLERDTGSPRVATRAKATPPAVASNDSAPTGSPTEIEGEWPMVSAVIDGTPLAAEMVKWCKRVTRGSRTQILAGPQSMLDAEFTLDASHTPRHIDYVNRSGKSKGKKQAGIYELDGDTLRICTAPPGGKRPTEFSSSQGDGRSYTVWRRG
jgi:uncharacterized protein (TIGR03067 family)